MPTTRRRISRTTAGNITAEAIDAWRQGDLHKLHRELRVRPWQVSPLRMDGASYDDPIYGAARAWELRQRLIEVAGQPGRVGRHGLPLGPA